MQITNDQMTKWPNNISISSQFSYEIDSIELHSCLYSFIIVFKNIYISKDNLDPSNIALRIHQNGTVLYSMRLKTNIFRPQKIFSYRRRHLVLNCEGDLHIFPFDSPMCTFAIESGKRKNKYFLNIVKPCLLVINNFNPFTLDVQWTILRRKK